VHVPVSVGKAYAASWSLFSNTPLQIPLDGNMSQHGDNGNTSVNNWDDLHGCQKPFPKHNLFNWAPTNARLDCKKIDYKKPHTASFLGLRGLVSSIFEEVLSI
ncbi:hypothetical protein L917_17658, partial [Phytophthora nicotianae]